MSFEAQKASSPALLSVQFDAVWMQFDAVWLLVKLQIFEAMVLSQFWSDQKTKHSLLMQFDEIYTLWKFKAVLCIP